MEKDNETRMIGVAVLGAALAATVQVTEPGSTRGDMRTAPNMGPGMMTRGSPMMG